MYRSSQEALRQRLEVTERELAATMADAAGAHAALAEARERLGRLRDGVAEEDDLDERGFKTSRRLLHVVSVCGLAVAIVGALLFVGMYFPDPYFSLQGVRNAAWIVRNREGLTGLAGAAGILVLSTPWAVLPLAGALGLARRRRWGWVVSTVATVLYLPTPLFPVSLVVLGHLLRSQTRRVFFAR